MLQKGQITPEQYLPSFKVSTLPGTLPTEQPATGGPAVNAPQGTDVNTPPVAPPTNDAMAAQSKQLLNSVPLQ